MVWISKDDAEKYPKFSNFVLAEARNAMGNPKILGAAILAAYTTFQRADAKLLLETITSLNTGTNPRIAPSFEERFRKDSSFFAEYEYISKTILINASLAGMFEIDPERVQLREAVKAIVLHEWVHHLDFVADGDFQDYRIAGGKKIRIPEVPERGWYFEELAFGNIKSKSL